MIIKGKWIYDHILRMNDSRRIHYSLSMGVLKKNPNLEIQNQG